VGAGHRGTRDGVGGRVGADPGRGDVDSGGEDVSARAKVGERGAVIVVVGGVDRDRGDVGGREVAAIGVAVARGGNDGEAIGNGSLDSAVEDGRDRATEGHRGKTLAAVVVLSSPADTGGNVGERARAETAKDLDADERDLLGKTVGGSTNSAGAVGAVAVVVGRVGSAVVEVGAKSGTATKL